jgi:hypothetical protein
VGKYICDKNYQYSLRNIPEERSSHVDDLLKFNVYGSVHRNNILVYKCQQDAQVTEFILSASCSTCFGRHYHPSLGAPNN